jgi:N-methylhydantoinase A/oxoprolinase/acetone carboxylase beta subunit
MAYNLAVDLGGTFTDILVFDELTEEGALDAGRPVEGCRYRYRDGL